MILITHDRSLIELVADRLWLAADGHVKPFNGDMDDYARFVLDRAEERHPRAGPVGGRRAAGEEKAKGGVKHPTSWWRSRAEAGRRLEPWPGGSGARGHPFETHRLRGVLLRIEGGCIQLPTASVTHFSVKLVFAAPASFFSAACLSQPAVASVSHFFMKLVFAAPAELLLGRLRVATRLRVSAACIRRERQRDHNGDDPDHRSPLLAVPESCRPVRR